jgi:WD40 repeat protein
MTELAGPGPLLELTPVAPDPEARGDDEPNLVFTGQAQKGSGKAYQFLRSYTPSDGGAPRLVVDGDMGALPCLCVYDTGTGALLRTLEAPDLDHWFSCLVTYQRPSDGRPRIAAGSRGGILCIWDGDDFQVLRTVQTNPGRLPVSYLAVYEEPTGGRTRLVSA